MDHARRHLPVLGPGLTDGELELLIAGVAELLAELDDARLAAADLGGERGRRQAQHLVRIVEDVLSDLAIAGRHAVELRVDPVQDGHGSPPDPFRRRETRPALSRAARRFLCTEPDLPFMASARGINYSNPD